MRQNSPKCYKKKKKREWRSNNETAAKKWIHACMHARIFKEKLTSKKKKKKIGIVYCVDAGRKRRRRNNENRLRGAMEKQESTNSIYGDLPTHPLLPSLCNFAMWSCHQDRSFSPTRVSMWTPFQPLPSFHQLFLLNLMLSFFPHFNFQSINYLW